MKKILWIVVFLFGGLSFAEEAKKEEPVKKEQKKKPVTKDSAVPRVPIYAWDAPKKEPLLVFYKSFPEAKTITDAPLYIGEAAQKREAQSQTPEKVNEEKIKEAKTEKKAAANSNEAKKPKEEKTEVIKIGPDQKPYVEEKDASKAKKNSEILEDSFGTVKDLKKNKLKNETNKPD